MYAELYALSTCTPHTLHVINMYIVHVINMHTAHVRSYAHVFPQFWRWSRVLQASSPPSSHPPATRRSTALRTRTPPLSPPFHTSCCTRLICSLCGFTRRRTICSHRVLCEMSPHALYLGFQTTPNSLLFLLPLSLSVFVVCVLRVFMCVCCVYVFMCFYVCVRLRSLLYLTFLQSRFRISGHVHTHFNTVTRGGACAPIVWCFALIYELLSPNGGSTFRIRALLNRAMDTHVCLQFFTPVTNIYIYI